MNYSVHYLFRFELLTIWLPQADRIQAYFAWPTETGQIPSRSELIRYMYSTTNEPTLNCVKHFIRKAQKELKKCIVICRLCLALLINLQYNCHYQVTKLVEWHSHCPTKYGQKLWMV